MLNKTIILVESNLPMQSLYHRELSRSFHVLVFSDVPGVLEAIKSQSVSAVVLEADLPSGKGWSTLEEIKQTTKVPIILLSTIDVRKKALQAKVDAYILKPIPPMALHDTLVQVCDQVPRPNLSTEVQKGD